MSRKHESLTIRDLFDAYVEIDGLTLDCTVTAELSRRSGSTDLESLRIKSVWIILPGPWRRIELPLEQFRTLHKAQYTKLDSLCVAEALRRADAADDTDWAAGSEEF